MELRQLNYFIAIVECGTVSGAARALNMSQPPLSAQMRLLEHELGCALFEHAGRRLRLTEAGRTLYARAKSISALCESARHEMADLSSGAAGVLRIGVISSVCGARFTAWLCSFARSYPGISYDLREANTYQLLAQLRSHAIDIAIVRTPFSAPDLCAEPLRRESMVAVGRAELMGDCAHEGAISLDALKGVPLVMYRRWEPILRERFERMGIAPRIMCVNDNAVTTMALAREGLGVALAPASTLECADCAELTALPIAAADLDSEIDAVYRSDAELTSAARLLLDALRMEKR